MHYYVVELHTIIFEQTFASSCALWRHSNTQTATLIYFKAFLTLLRKRYVAELQYNEYVPDITATVN